MKKQLTSILVILLVLLISAGLAAAGSFSGAVWNSIPVFALSIGLAFLIQWTAFIPAYLQKTEKFFDLIGSLSYISITILAFIFSGMYSVRAILLTGLIIIWAGRLGLFLFQRIHKAGEDVRFREIKQSFWRFLVTWTIQGLWISFTFGAALAAITSGSTEPFGLLGLIGLLIWMIGFGIEVIADQQKSAFRAKEANAGKFIQTGLWSWSRHPNYFGEILLWIGIALIAIPALSGWQFITLISPVFVTLLLTKISGIPLLEQKADERWGGLADYEAYKSNTSVLVPLPPRKE